MSRARRSAVIVVLLALGSAVGPSTGAARTADENSDLAKLAARLRAEEPFLADHAANEILKLGREALPELSRMVQTTEDRPFRLRIELLFRELFRSFLLELENEHRSLDSDRRELAELHEHRDALARLSALENAFATWRERFAGLDEKIEEHLDLRALEARASAPDGVVALTDAEKDRLDELRVRGESRRVEIPEIDEIAERSIEYRRLRARKTSLEELSEVEALRATELDERIRVREPDIGRLLDLARRVGLLGCSEIAARSEEMPLQGAADPRDLRTPTQMMFEELLDSFRADDDATHWDGALDDGRYDRSWLWTRELRTAGPRAEIAERLLAEHCERTLRDLDSPITLIRERAELELYRLGRRGLAALAPGASAPTESDTAPRPLPNYGASTFLAGLLRWRISPETYRQTGVHFADYDELEFAARRRKIFQYARVAGERAIPTLRAIVDDDGLEPSFLVKYAAAKALATQLGDRLGYLTLKAANPKMVLERPEIAREILIIQGFAHIRAKDYEAAVIEFAKILEEYPFDFDGNYYIAFAYLLLKNYPKAIHHFEIAKRIHADDQLTLYNLACAYSLGGFPEKALEALDQSVDAGFRDADHIENDPDLDPIRAEPRYQIILKKARG